MFSEKSFDNYIEAVNETRRLTNRSTDGNVVQAFQIGLRKTPAVLLKRFENSNHEMWYPIAYTIWDGVVHTMKVTAGAVAIGAIVGGVAGSYIPIAGTVAGAKVGAAVGLGVVTWYLSISGIVSITALAGSIAGTVSFLFEQGISKARAGNIEDGAHDIAKGFAKIVEMVTAAAILFCFAKGSAKISAKLSGVNLGSNPRLLGLLKWVPTPITNIRARLQHSKWGYAVEEIIAIRTMSRNGGLYVIRACNPSRLKVGRGNPLPAKGLEIKGSSIRGGVHAGKVGVNADDIEKLRKSYDFVTVNDRQGKLVGYRIKLKNGKKGELDNHFLESASHLTFEDGDIGKFILYNAKHEPYIPDMDRLVCMRLTEPSEGIGAFHPKLKDLAKFGDDPEEIAEFNRILNELLGTKKVNYYAVKHGYTSSNVDKATGKPIWHTKENETLLVFIDGRAFEMKWNEFVLFCDSHRTLGLPQCFKQVDS